MNSEYLFTSLYSFWSICRLFSISIFSFSNSSRLSGGYSDVVKMVYSMLDINTKAPIAKAILTDGGTGGSSMATVTFCDASSGRIWVRQQLSQQRYKRFDTIRTNREQPMLPTHQHEGSYGCFD